MIAVLGAQGQLGRDFLSRCPVPTRAVTRAELDLTRPESFEPWLDETRPAIVLNCAAYNLVDRAEDDQATAFQVNVWGPYHFAKLCARRGVRFVQISTDYVFGADPHRQTPYDENDTPGPVSLYGLSKLSGEHAVRMAHPEALIVRTCGLYGLHGVGGKGGNFVETMLRVASQGKPLRVVADQYCTPTATIDLADMLLQLIEAQVTGLIHAVNEGSTSWFEFAAEIFRQSGIDADLTPIPTRDYPTPARRPGYSVLSTARLAQVAGIKNRPWQAALAEYLSHRALSATNNESTTR